MFHTYKPHPPLSDFVENLWSYRGFEAPRLRERIFPSGTFELVFNLSADEIRIYKGNESEECERYSGAILSGPYSGFFVTDTALETSVMGAHFKPGGTFPFLGASANEFADKHVDVDTIWGACVAGIRERLAETTSSRLRFRLIERFLATQISRPLQHHSAVSLALSTLDHARSRMTRELAREACLSEKRFIDIFRFEVGLRPKLFNRISRFQRVLTQMHRVGVPHWAQLALDNGYFDQSHLIHDFSSFSGFSPADYIRRLDSLRSQRLEAKFNHLPLTR